MSPVMQQAVWQRQRRKRRRRSSGIRSVQNHHVTIMMLISLTSVAPLTTVSLLQSSRHHRGFSQASWFHHDNAENVHNMLPGTHRHCSVKKKSSRDLVGCGTSSSSFPMLGAAASRTSRMSLTRLQQSSSASKQPNNANRWTVRWARLMMGNHDGIRPHWAREWMPTWLVTLRPMAQLTFLLVMYAFHTAVLTQNSIHLPFQLIPNQRGHFQSIGLDSIAGMATLLIYRYFRATDPLAAGDDKTTAVDKSPHQRPQVPDLLSVPRVGNAPWKHIYKSEYSRVTSFLAILLLGKAYLWTGGVSMVWEDIFYGLANHYPITTAMHRSLCVLFGHLTWIGLGAIVLRVVPRPQNFFKDRWFSQKWNTQWLWWTIGGYCVSSWAFNIADVITQAITPVTILAQAQDSIVSQLVDPEYQDWLASFVGYIAPCVTAPWWEEVLYRGFLLPALILQMNYKWAILWNGILFAVHHQSPVAMISLTFLGWIWSILYTKSGNLWTTILVHAMWNSRVFLSGWFGL